MIDSGLTVRLLPACLIIKDFVRGDSNCNYEKYLVEFLNGSTWFRNKVENKLFAWREKQDNGECDTFAGEYELDFKLLVSATACQARRELSAGITVLPQGQTLILSSRRNDSISATRLYAALRQLSVEDLLGYENGDFKYGTVEHDVQTAIATINFPKNILFFLPYDFSVDDSCDLEYMIHSIRLALEHDYLSLLQLRTKRQPNNESYLSCLCSDVILFFKFENNVLNYIDCVNTIESKTYTDLCWKYIY